MSIRPIQIEDLLFIQNCNLFNLPENYQFKYYLYHILTWPELSWVAEVNGDIVGYVLAKMDEDESKLNGHITSISVVRKMRKLGFAETLMRMTCNAMASVYSANYVTLHVRVSNSSALHLYKNCLEFQVISIDPKYYADGEDAYSMRKQLKLKS